MDHYGPLMPFGFKISFQNESILIKSRKRKKQFGFGYQFEMLPLI